MKRGLGIIWIMVLAMMMSVSAYAMPVTIEDGALEASVTTAEGEAVDISITEFQLLGRTAEGAYLLFADGQYLALDEAAMAPVIDALGSEIVESLPLEDNYTPLARRDSSEGVQKMQENLIALGYMEGEADGNYGGQSERIVGEFQAAMGLETTGAADARLQMLMESLLAEPVTVSVEEDVEARFEVISGKTEANLDTAIELGLRLDYDDIAGLGMIYAGEPIAYEAPAQADIDRRAFELRFGMAVEQDTDGLVQVAPVLDITSVGVQRPVMKEVILKSGDERRTYAVTALENGLSGLKAVEKGRVMLDADGVEMLANAVEEGELKVRVTGKYDSYDITVSADALQNVAKIGEAALDLED